MISIRNVKKFFGANSAIDNISLDIESGENTLLLGPSGSGKTTLLRMINGLVAPSSGRVTIGGQDIRMQPQHELRRQIGYVLQRNSLFPHYTVEENISVVPNLLKWDKKTTAKRARELMEKLHLPERYLSRRPDQLSGGEAQRVNIARALAADPPILLMDEPFSALDTVTKRSIREEFIKLEELRSKTIIMVSHDIQEAFEMGDSIVLLHQGRLVQKGNPSRLLYSPASDFVTKFLSSDYLQLSFASLSIADLWNYLPVTSYDQPDGSTPVIGTTLWKAMELFQDGSRYSRNLWLGHERLGKWKCVTWHELMDAYCLHQNRNRR